MSLILEALRKLEREKQTPERGLVVTGATTWARAEERRGLKLALIVVAGLALGAGVWLWRGRGVQAPTSAADAGGMAARGVVPASRTPAGVTPAAASEQEPADARLATRLPAGASVSTGASGAPTEAPSVTGAVGVRGRPSSREDNPAWSAPAARTGAAARGPSGASQPSQPAGVAIAEPAAAGDAKLGTPADDTSAAAEPTPPRSATSDTPRERTTTPAAGAPEKPATHPDDEVILQAVTERDGRPLAIVNGHLVREGDSFDGIRILRIRASEIEVEVKGRRRTVGF